MWTVRHAAGWAVEADGGSSGRRHEIDTLLASILGLTRTGLYVDSDRILTTEEIARFRENWNLRLDGTPLQHLTGFVDFLDLTFRVDSRALVPRQETESVVLEALEMAGSLPGVPGREEQLWIDVGTGSGVIAVSLAASHIPMRVIATDLSADALRLAELNAAGNGVEDRIDFIQGDLLEPVSKSGQADGIVANLPYIPSGAIQGLPVDVRDHDPLMALDGGEDGLDFFRRLIPEAAEVLRSGGALVLEAGDDQSEAIRSILENDGNWKSLRTGKDLSGRQRVVSAALSIGFE